MSVFNIPLRCYASRLADGRWHAVCIDLQLSLHGPSLTAVRAAMTEQVAAFMQSARLHQVANRIPLGLMLKYAMASLRGLLGHVNDHVVFTEAVTMRPR